MNTSIKFGIIENIKTVRRMVLEREFFKRKHQANMKYVSRISWVVMVTGALAALLPSCASPVSAPATPLPTTTELIEPGDTLNGMSFRIAESRRDWGITLWSFCDLTFEPFVSEQIDYSCNVPPLRWVFLGYGSSAKTVDEVDALWKTRAWEMYVDGQPVNLPAFGTIDDSYAGYKSRYWNVVLVNPTPGRHTLRYVIYDNGCGCGTNEQSLLAEITWEFSVSE